jgi:uncharacterized protein (TIGR02246 family)
VLIANAGVASAKYDRTIDGKTRVWHNVSAQKVQPRWSGDRDEKGYATGKGTLTWYRVDHGWETGSFLPDSKYVPLAKYTGKMVEGKLQGPVVSIDAKGRTFHAKFEDGTRKGEWAAGSMSGSKKEAGSEAKAPKVAGAQTDRPKPEAPKVDIPAEAPPPAPKLDQHVTTTPAAEAAQSKDSSANQAADMEQHSLQDLTRPPSSLRVASLSQPSTQTSAPTTETVETAATEPMSAASSPAASAEVSLNDDDAKAVSALDGEYQAAVKANDSTTMDRILADDFVLVGGAGQSWTKADLLKQARDKQGKYERHEVEQGTQKVRVWHDTAVVTETVWVKGTENGKPVDHKVSVTATYVRTPGGWRYVSSQASTPGK